MSITSIAVIQTRIRVATPESPIAVFKLPILRGRGFLEAMFGSTVQTHRIVQNGDPMFVGYFHNQMAASDVRKTLAAACG